MHHIRQVATLLDYGEPQILEVFKNTLHARLYWLGSIPIRQLAISSRDGEENFNKGENRQIIS